MQNFDYYNPTHIIFGQGRIAELKTQIPVDARILLLYGGGSIKHNGTYDETLTALKGCTVFEFSGIEPNPTYETLMKAVEIVKQENINFLLAVGGGSVIDGTKFIAAASCFEGDPWTILETHGRNVTAAMPFGAILTLPATGSEMNEGAVITRAEIKAKLAFSNPLVFPKFSILDPTKTYTLPTRQIANGVVDAFVHVMEQYLTYPAAGMVQDRFSEGLLLTLIEAGPLALTEPENYEVRANLMWAATMALNGLISTGVPQDWATHMLGHELTALYGLDHAQTLAIVLPSMMEVRRDEKRDKLLQYAERVWNIKNVSDDARIDLAIAKTRQFFEKMGIKTHLGDYQLGSEAIDAVVDQLGKHGMTALGEHKTMDLTVSRQVMAGTL